jgi:hypothetical protein
MLTLLFTSLFPGRQPAAPAGLEPALSRAIGEGGAVLAGAYRTLDGRSEIVIGGDKVFHAASTLIELVRADLSCLVYSAGSAR